MKEEGGNFGTIDDEEATATEFRSLDDGSSFFSTFVSLTAKFVSTMFAASCGFNNFVIPRDLLDLLICLAITRKFYSNIFRQWKTLYVCLFEN